ncbi:MAG: DUF362 domain-containing protein [Syntrophales bacterium]|nr:DUF362 domain-containing protein [Syntrophales bacterium]
MGITEPLRARPVFSGITELVTVEAVARGAAPETVVAAVQRVAEAASDFSWLSRGDVVFLKPAGNSGHRYPATTSPLAVLGMVSLLREKGAGRVIVGDKSGVQFVYQDDRKERGSSRRLYTRNGLHQAALDAGAEVHYFEEAGYQAYFGDKPEHPQSHWQGELMLPEILTRVDHVVLLPRVSRHVLAGSTLGLKAAVGWLRDDSRLELHREARSFVEKIVEINDTTTLKQKLRLVLTVATKVQSTFGPDQGFAAEPDLGLVFASESLLAHDLTALGWLLWNREYATPAAQLSRFHDPYQTYPGAFNRAFVGYIWGVGELLQSGTYTTRPILSAATDPQLSWAAHLWGGFPQLELGEAGKALPPVLKEYLLEKASS